MFVAYNVYQIYSKNVTSMTSAWVAYSNRMVQILSTAKIWFMHTEKWSVFQQRANAFERQSANLANFKHWFYFIASNIKFYRKWHNIFFGIWRWNSWLLDTANFAFSCLIIFAFRYFLKPFSVCMKKTHMWETHCHL